MKRMLRLILLPLLLALGTSACALLDTHYEAYVTIVNIGNLAMYAAVDGDRVTIPALDSHTWAVELDHEDEVATVRLTAEPVIGGDHDSATVTLHGDRDIRTWLTGWDRAAAAPARKPGRIVTGSAASPLEKTP